MRLGNYRTGMTYFWGSGGWAGRQPLVEPIPVLAQLRPPRLCLRSVLSSTLKRYLEKMRENQLWTKNTGMLTYEEIRELDTHRHDCSLELYFNLWKREDS